MEFKASLPSLLFISALFLASVSFADRDLDACLEQCPRQDLGCQMSCLQHKQEGGGRQQPLVPREVYEKICQQRCQSQQQKTMEECERSCVKELEQQQQQQRQGGGGIDINDDEGEMWEEMREDMCEKSCLLQLGEDGDQQQQEQCERSCQRRLTLQYKQCRRTCQKQPKNGSKKRCQTQCRVKIEQEQQEKLEQQEQEQLEQEQQEQEQQGQQGQESSEPTIGSFFM